MEYNAIFKEYLNNGNIEACTDNISGGRFIPNHPVIKENVASTKLKIVLTTSAPETDGQSVNSCLHDATNLLPNILRILFRRLNRFCFTGDIQKAFLQIGIKVNESDFMKFMWQ